MGGEHGVHVMLCAGPSQDPTIPNRCEDHVWYETGVTDRVLSLHMTLVGDLPLIVAAHHSPKYNLNGVEIPETRSLVLIRCRVPTCQQSNVVNVINNPQILGVQIVADITPGLEFPIILYSQNDSDQGRLMLLACTKADCSGFNYHMQLDSNLMTWVNALAIDQNDGSLYMVAPLKDPIIVNDEVNHVVMRIDNPLHPFRK